MNKEITYNGKKYKSYAQLSDEMNINRETLYSRLRTQMPLEKAISKELYKGKSIMYNGILYSSLSSLAKSYNINKSTLRNRLEVGMSIEDAIEKEVTKGRCILYNGKLYKTLKHLAMDANIDYAKLMGRLSVGMSIEDAIECGNINLLYSPQNYHGKDYNSLKELVITTNKHNYNTVLDRINRGMSADKAIDCKLMVQPIPIVYEGVYYESIAALAYVYNIKPQTLHARIFRYKYPVDIAIKMGPGNGYKKGITVKYNGKIYDSYKSLAEDYGINYSTFKHRLRRGKTIDQAIKMGLNAVNKKVTYNGIEYNSLYELAKAYNINYNCIISRLKKGMSIEEAINNKLNYTSNSKKVTYNGKIYDSYKSLAEDYGIGYSVLRSRLQQGMSVDEAINKGLRDNSIEYKGKIYKSLNELSKQYDIKYNTLYNRIRTGMSIEEALEGVKKL